MKRYLASVFITAYLGFLSWGIVAHALSVGVSAHPAMYFTVWDMFCGWTAWSSRLHVIGEGESGQYYEVVPGPWGEIKPYGDLGRRHYDVNGYFCGQFAVNTLENTEHEPIVRVFVIEECWHKKYNLPDHVWKMKYDEPKNVKKYYHIRQVFTADGRAIYSNHSWAAQQVSISVANNPRLQADLRRNRPFYAVPRHQRVSPSNAPLNPNAN